MSPRLNLDDNIMNPLTKHESANLIKRTFKFRNIQIEEIIIMKSLLGCYVTSLKELKRDKNYSWFDQNCICRGGGGGGGGGL